MHYIGPGLIDLQINGIDGIDFNDASLRPEDIETATSYLLSKGITTFFPTIITNADENVHAIIKTIVQASKKSKLVNACVGGIHIEGPFISKIDGARGAHDLQYIKAPDWEWVRKCQEIAEGMIKLITISPEWKGSSAFIHQCREHDILVSIGHSNASPEQIREAVTAGAGMSTHLGNGLLLMLPRHPNLLWEQLAHDGLFASIIADGFHLPDAFLKVVIKTKGSRAFLVSDSTCFSGMPPGVYQTHIGDEVVLEKGGRLAMKKSPDLLAGATKNLLENIQYLLGQKLLDLAEVWKMASLYPANFLGMAGYGMLPDQPADLVVFDLKNEHISIQKVIKLGQLVYEG